MSAAMFRLNPTAHYLNIQISPDVRIPAVHGQVWRLDCGICCCAGEVVDLQYYQPMGPEQGVFPVLKIHSVMQASLLHLATWCLVAPLGCSALGIMLC